MPRRKHWRKSDSKRREKSRTDDSETTVTGKYTGSPEQFPAGSPGRYQAGSPEQMPAGSRGRYQAGSPEQMPAGSPDRNQARSPERMPAQSPEKKSRQKVRNGCRHKVLKKAGIKSRKASTQQ